jgi:hypothetical protein
MREPTEDAIAADFARDRYVIKQMPQTSDYERVAQCCVATVLIAAGCAVALALAYGLGWLQ